MNSSSKVRGQQHIFFKKKQSTRTFYTTLDSLTMSGEMVSLEQKRKPLPNDLDNQMTALGTVIKQDILT